LLFTGEETHALAAQKIHEGALAEEYGDQEKMAMAESKVPTQTIDVVP
jgi:hypothetical protein